MDLNYRLEILKNSGQISSDTQNKLIETIEMIYQSCGIRLKEENGSMLITHMAIALERIKRGESAESAGDEIYKQIKKHEKFFIAQKILKTLEKGLEVYLPQSEELFILMHLCVLLDKESKKV